MSQPARVLLLYAHPESQDSVANRVLLNRPRSSAEFTVHDLYAHYPIFLLISPVQKASLREHEVIVFHILFNQLPGATEKWLDRY